VSVSPTSSEITTRLSFRLSGSLAKDPSTPAEDLKLYLNGIQGPQEIEFPPGRRINPLTVVFALDGNANYYPFDRYSSSMRIMVTRKSAAVRRSASPAVHWKTHTPLSIESADELLMTAPQEGERVPISSSVLASIPGMKIDGERVDRIEQGIEGFDLVIRRADNVIVVSVLTMTLMMSLAVSVLLMSLRALIMDEKMELLPLSLCVSLLFGLPALRNAQPAVPPLGVLGDYLSFLWAESVVAVSAVMVIWTWLIRQRKIQSLSDRQIRENPT
jgi:hypothetical protein